MSKVEFLKTALRDYRVGAVIPSSKYTIDRVLHEIKPQYRYVVEYGAGDGIITKALLRQLPKEGVLVAIESNPDFLRTLKAIPDLRLRVVAGDVVKLSEDFRALGLPEADFVVSGIPFTFLPGKARRSVAARTAAALRDGGKFVLYQTSPLMFPYLKAEFSKVRLLFEPRNFPPYFIMVAEK